MEPARPAAAIGDAEIAAFLRANPAWLAEHAELYGTLLPPVRVHGEPFADHMAAMLRAARAQTDGLVRAGRAAAGLVERVQTAVLALMRAADPLDFVAHALPFLLGIDAAALCLENACLEVDRPGARLLPGGVIAKLLGGRDVVLREAPADAALIHGEAAALARYDALIRVPLTAAPGLLAMAARDGGLLRRTDGMAAQGAVCLGFLGRALAAALER